MKNWLRQKRKQFKYYYYWRNYYLSKLFPPKVPRRPLSFLPNGFEVNSIGNSGVRIVEHFCSEAGASYIISRSKEVASETLGSMSVFNATHQDQVLMPLLYRASMLTGLPLNHIGSIDASKEEPLNTSYQVVEDLARDKGLACFRVHLFLTDFGELRFPELDLAVEARSGRAVIWPLNQGSISVDCSENSDNDRWVAKFTIYENQVFKPDSIPELIPQIQKGVPVDSSEELPDGSWCMDYPNK
jgi:hypothetical protein